MRERLNFPLIFVVLEHPVRRLAARALKLTYCPIEMYGPGKNVPQPKRARIPCILLLYVKRTIRRTPYIYIASSPGPFPAFQCCMLSALTATACNIEKLGMGLGTRLHLDAMQHGCMRYMRARTAQGGIVRRCASCVVNTPRNSWHMLTKPQCAVDQTLPLVKGLASETILAGKWHIW